MLAYIVTAASTDSHLYCPYCRTRRPLVRAGKLRGWAGYERQRYLCKVCYRCTVNPRHSESPAEKRR